MVPVHLPQVPKVSRGGVAVTHMEANLRAWYHFRERMRAGNHEVVAARVDGRERETLKRQEPAMMRARPRNPRQPCLPRPARHRVEVAHRIRQYADQEIRLRKHLEQLLEASLG